MAVSSNEGSVASSSGAQPYVATVVRLDGGPPLAYWRLASTDSFLDEMGVRNGSWTTPGGMLVPGLPRGSNGAVDFRGVATAEVPHDDGLALPAFSLSFWFKMGSAPPDDGRFVVLARDETGNRGSDFAIYVEEDGSLVLGYQIGIGGREILPGVPPTISAGETHHLVVRSDATGFDAYLDGVYLGKNTTFTDAWASNTAPLRFANAPWRTEIADCVLDEVALYGRVLTEAEILELAQRTSPPVAENDNAAVRESAMTALNVTANDTFVGSKADLSLTIVSQPAGGDRVAVNDNNDIEYTAGAVSQDTARSFTYRIIDRNGTSNTAMVRVIVQEAVQPPSGNGLCFVTQGAEPKVVGEMADLEAAIASAPAGQHILIAPGTYSGGTLVFANTSGTEAAPIVIRPRDELGSVTINKPAWTISGRRIIVSQMHFNDARLLLDDGARFNRITRCQFRQVGGITVQIFAAQDTRIDHCDISDFLSDTNPKCFIRLRHTNVGNGTCRRVLVDYNYIHDSNPSQGVNGCDIIGLSSSSGGAAGSNPELIIDHCLYSNVSIPREGELIGTKCSGIVLRYTTFVGTRHMYVNMPRQGANCQVRSCWFENTPPLHVWQDNSLVIGNRFTGEVDLWCAAGTKYAGITPTVESGYGASRNGRYIGNRMERGHIQVGGYWSKSMPRVPALNNNLWNNTRDSGGDAHALISGRHEGTTFLADNEPFDPAIRLDPADVGLKAPDPLCG